MLYLIFWVLAGIAVGMIASSKGRSFGGWFAYGVLLVPIALIHVLLVGPAGAKSAHGVRACPWCAEPIKFEAIVCKHCGRDVERPAKPGPDFVPDGI